jgi:hypothetical protein
MRLLNAPTLPHFRSLAMCLQAALAASGVCTLALCSLRMPQADAQFLLEACAGSPLLFLFMLLLLLLQGPRQVAPTCCELWCIGCGQRGAPATREWCKRQYPKRGRPPWPPQDRVKYLEYAASGTSVFALNRGAWALEEDPKQIGMGFYI